MTDHGSPDLDPVFVGRQADLVVNPHLGHDQPELARHPLAHRLEPVEQVAAARRVGQADQAEADLELERIDVQQVFHALGRCRDRRGDLTRGQPRTHRGRGVSIGHSAGAVVVGSLARIGAAAGSRLALPRRRSSA